MKRNGPQTPVRRDKRYLVIPFPVSIPRNVRNFSLLCMLVIGSNVVTHKLWNTGSSEPTAGIVEKVSAQPGLYLMDKAAMKVGDSEAFANKVREISEMLGVPPEWTMAVMYAESGFDPSILNRKGSGATGLIQFMPSTALELNVSVERLKRMTALQQLEYVYLYMQNVRDRYGEYETLADFYLAILYPKARRQDYCYTLYATPSQSYKQNSGLDEDKDGRVTVSDIDKHMKRLYPTAYMAQKHVIAGM